MTAVLGASPLSLHAAYAAPAIEGTSDLLVESQKAYRVGNYFRAARYAFAARQTGASIATQAEANSWVTLSLIQAHLYQSAAYFFIRTLQSEDKPAIRRVLTKTQELMDRVGGDLFRRYLIRHTSYEDYDGWNRSAYLYSLGKDALLQGNPERAIGYLNGISPQSPLWPFGLQIRGTAYAIQGKGDSAHRDFRSCAELSGESNSGPNETDSTSVKNLAAIDPAAARVKQHEADDLRARCRAGDARTSYQEGQFLEADRTYDEIPKESLVWPDILFEQAWNSFGRQEYNRTLGKLVSYQSPALNFVFNSEVEVLRAQAYLALCLYDDANVVINDFNLRYARVGEQVKNFVEANSDNMEAFYGFGKDALRASLYTTNDSFRMANRFVRGPYFRGLVASEESVSSELMAAHRFSSMQGGTDNEPGRGFPGFLDLVLQWRARTTRGIGGMFVKNSLMDYHAVLISDFEKMSFIKLEMLSRAKAKLMNKTKSDGEGDRLRGNVRPHRRDDQLYWSFNGEFWTDELGDYVFGLESECKSGA